MRIKQTKFFILGLLGILASLFVIFIKISPFRCCGCPPEGYMLYPLILTLIENRWAWVVDCVCPKGECVKTFYIIPIDLLVVSFGSFILSFTNIKISFSKALLILFLLVLLGIGLSIPVLLFKRIVPSHPPDTYPVKEVTIITDKTGYEQGETVKITVKNGLDKSIWYVKETCPTSCCNLHKLENSEWKNLGNPMSCIQLVPPPAGRPYFIEPDELKLGEGISKQWDMMVEGKLAEGGKYRFSFYYGLSKDNYTDKTIYSNEFRIKEKEIVLDEKYCEQNADCACGVHIETGECFYGNIKYVLPFPQCPDFCTGFAGNLRIRCVNNECKQVPVK